MTKIYSKFIFSIFSMMFIINSFYYINFCQAGSSAEIYNQLEGAGKKAWGKEASVFDMPQIVQVVISAFLSLLGIIFLVLIIYAGYNWMTAQGEEEKVTKAKDTLQRAVIGLIIIAAAYSITYFVFQNLSGDGVIGTQNNAGGG